MVYVIVQSLKNLLLITAIFLSCARPCNYKDVLKSISFKLNVKARLGQGWIQTFSEGEAKLCNVGLGKRPQWGPGAKPLVRGSEGRSPPEADDILFFSETNFLTKLSHILGKFRLHGERQSVSMRR